MFLNGPHFRIRVIQRQKGNMGLEKGRQILVNGELCRGSGPPRGCLLFALLPLWRTKGGKGGGKPRGASVRCQASARRLVLSGGSAFCIWKTLKP